MNTKTDAEIRATMTSEQIRLERKLTCEAINGAIAFGYQNTNSPPDDDHWLAPFWNIGRERAQLEAKAALPSDAAQAPIEPAGEASSMPGTKGFTMAIFEAEKVPVGTKIYIAPVAPAAGAPGSGMERAFSSDAMGRRDEVALLNRHAETPKLLALLGLPLIDAIALYDVRIRLERALATAEPSEDAYVAQRMAETLADVYTTIIGDDERPDDEALNAIERVKKAAQVLRLEVELYRAHSAELASTKSLFLAACADLGAINEALGLDPEDGGAEPILDAIAELKRERDQLVDSNYAIASSTAAAAPTRAEFALKALVAAGHVTQSKVDEALEIARTTPGVAASLAPLAAAGLTDEQRTTIQHAADKLRTVWANHTGDKESRELCHKLEAFLDTPHGDKRS